jgi:hypothetical protein
MCSLSNRTSGCSAGELEREVGDPGHPGPSEDRLLDRGLVREPAADAPTDLAVLALDVLPHDDELHVLRGPQRALHAVEDPDRAQVDVLAERPADRDEQAPQRDVVGHPGPADGAEEDRLEAAEDLQPVGRHHRALLLVAPARPVELGVLERDAVPRAHGVEHLAGGGDDLRADPVARDDGDLLCRRLRGGHGAPRPSSDTISGRNTMISIAPSTSKVTPERIIVVIGTAPEP